MLIATLFPVTPARRTFVDAPTLEYGVGRRPFVDRLEDVSLETIWKPLIGITPSAVPYEADHGSFRRYVSMTAYADAVAAAGGIPVIMPFIRGDVPALIGRLDGLVLSGGADIAPSRFGDDAIHPDTYDVDPARDEFEIALVHEALSREKPVLAICRGIQVLNVALGGTLHQHVPDAFTGIVHRQQHDGIPADQPGHVVAIVPGTALERTVGAERLPVNSFHHQGLKALAPDLVATATSDDGLVEAVEHRTYPDVIAVQWHPELMASASEAQAGLFRNLVRTSAAAMLPF